MTKVEITWRVGTKNTAIWSGDVDEDRLLGFRQTLEDAIKQEANAVALASKKAEDQRIEKEERVELARLIAKYGVKGGIADVGVMATP